jgi:MFS family permease
MDVDALAGDGPAASEDRALAGHMAATWSLFFGLFLLLTGAGLIGSLIGIRAELEGFSTFATGIISASYYAGFLVGSRLAFASLGRVGHVRVYVALAALASAAVLAHAVVLDPTVWTIMRFVTGLCMAGQYVVAESWLNDLASNETRGRLLALYMVVVNIGYGCGQVLLGSASVAGFTLFGYASILISLAVVPVALAESSAPPFRAPTRVSLRELAGIVPTGVISAGLIGVAHGALTGMGSLYAAKAHLSTGQIAVFMAAPMVGGVVNQWPVSAASDDVDRRAVAVVVSLVAAGSAAALATMHLDAWPTYLLMAALGGFSYPLYSLAAAYTNDWVDPEHLMAAASQLVTVYGAGAFVGPLVTSALMNLFGNRWYFWSLLGVHVVIAAYVFYRMLAWRSPLVKQPWSEVSVPARAFFVPATLVAMGRRRLRQTREARATPP